MQANSEKKWGSKFEDFWCCHCTAVQANARLRELIYHEYDGNLYINQYLESIYIKDEQIIEISLLDSQDLDAIEYQIKTTNSNYKKLYLRVPNWAENYNVIGDSKYEKIEGYIVLSGDVDLKIRFSRKVNIVCIEGNDEYIGLRFGPIALAAINCTSPLYDKQKPLTYQKSRVESAWDVRFINEQNIEFVPIHTIGKEKYTLYLKRKVNDEKI